MQNYKIKTISKNDHDYPETFRHLHTPPEKIHTRGNIELLTAEKRVGIVGSRKVSAYGRAVTSKLASELSLRGVVIVSGLALGVDSLAHRTTVAVNKPTIAVLPAGIDMVYPSTHHGLADQILKTNGLLISEYGPGTPALKHQFIERNRLISALSSILVITEAAEQSGSLHTARFALELGVSVMAVPGQITSPLSSGTNRLIQNGAVPVLSSDDILSELGLAADDPKDEYYPENEAEAAILKKMQAGVHNSNELLIESGLTASTFQAQLTMLEIKGIIYPSGGNWHMR